MLPPPPDVMQGSAAAYRNIVRDGTGTEVYRPHQPVIVPVGFIGQRAVVFKPEAPTFDVGYRLSTRSPEAVRRIANWSSFLRSRCRVFVKSAKQAISRTGNEAGQWQQRREPRLSAKRRTNT